MMERKPKVHLPAVEIDQQSTAQVQEWARDGRMEPDAKAYTMGPCRIIVGSTEQTGWHLSISRADFYPGWDEIAAARYALIPDEITMVMVLPPPSEYVALHDNTFHLHQATIDEQKQFTLGRP